MPLKKEQPTRKEKFTLLYFGVIARRRGVFFVLEQLKKLVKEHPQLHLKLIGPVDKAERDDFEKLIQDSTLQSQITYTPWILVEDLPKHANECDIALSPLEDNPQHNSGVANKVFQYMSLGIPLLVSDCKPQQKIIEENSCGWVYKANDAESFREALEAAQNHPDLLSMGQNGRKAILEKYNTQKAGQGLVNYYQNEAKNYEA
jgi:glycosyltransferase involved in cell wall biosynthesis